MLASPRSPSSTTRIFSSAKRATDRERREKRHHDRGNHSTLTYLSTTLYYCASVGIVSV
jgi:hypothetical protein